MRTPARWLHDLVDRGYRSEWFILSRYLASGVVVGGFLVTMFLMVAVAICMLTLVSAAAQQFSNGAVVEFCTTTMETLAPLLPYALGAIFLSMTYVALTAPRDQTHRLALRVWERKQMDKKL